MSRDRDRRGAIVGTAGTLALLLSAVLVVVSIGATLVLSLPEGARTLALAFAAFVPLNLFQRIHLAVLQAELKIGAFNVVRVAGAVVYVVALGLLPLVGAATTGGVIAALLVGNLVWCGLAAALVGRPLLRRRPDHARRLLGYGLRAHLGSMTPLDTLRLDQLVLALFLPAAALGLYVTAMTVAIANRLLGVSLGVVAFPVAARTPPGQARRPFLQLLVTTAVLSTVAAAFEIAFGRQLLALLFPPEFADARAPRARERPDEHPRRRRGLAPRSRPAGRGGPGRGSPAGGAPPGLRAVLERSRHGRGGRRPRGIGGGARCDGSAGATGRGRQGPNRRRAGARYRRRRPVD